MCTIIEFSDKYKDDLVKFLVGAETLVKEPDFNLPSEMKIFVGANKKVKNNYRIFLSLNKEKKLNGVIAISNEGKIALLASDKNGLKERASSLIKKAESLFKNQKTKTIKANMSSKYLIIFNEVGYKTIRFTGDEGTNSFLVEKNLISERQKS